MDLFITETLNDTIDELCIRGVFMGVFVGAILLWLRILRTMQTRLTINNGPHFDKHFS